jgi:hypothetical protein
VRIAKTKAGLIQTVLRAFPFIAMMGGMAVGGVLFTVGYEVPDFVQGGHLGQYLLMDVTIGGILGCIGGISLSCFGRAALHHVTIVDDRIRKMRYNAKGEFIETKIKSFYTKADVADGEKSMIRTAEKQKVREEKIKKADEKEVAKIREKFEKEKNKSSASKSGITKSSVNNSSASRSGATKSSANNSSANNSAIKKPSNSGVQSRGR